MLSVAGGDGKDDLRSVQQVFRRKNSQSLSESCQAGGARRSIHRLQATPFTTEPGTQGEKLFFLPLMLKALRPCLDGGKTGLFEQPLDLTGGIHERLCLN